MIQTVSQSVSSQVSSPSATEVIAYLRHSYRWAEIIDAIERETKILALSEQHDIEITDEEWQAAGDAFRRQHRLLGIKQTQAWLEKQKITLEEWSEGLKYQLLLTKLKEHLFGANVDAHYVNNRDRYRRVALSQILVRDLDEAVEIAQLLREHNASFYALAIEHSLGKQSKINGGFMGIRFLNEIAPDIVEAIKDGEAGAIIGPIQSQVGYHIVRVEKWFPLTFDLSVREQVLESLWQAWLQENH